MQFKFLFFFKQLVIVLFFFKNLFILKFVNLSWVKSLFAPFNKFAFLFSSFFVFGIPQFKYLFSNSRSSFELNTLELVEWDLKELVRINSFSLTCFMKFFWFSHIDWLWDPLHKFYMEEEFKKQTIIRSVDIDVNRLMSL